MKQHLTQRNGGRLVIAGVIVVVISFCLSFVTLFSAYSKFNPANDPHHGLPIALDVWFAKSLMVLAYFGLALLFAGVIVYELAKRQNKK